MNNLPDQCPQCDASQMPRATTCWMCGAPLGEAGPRRESPPVLEVVAPFEPRIEAASPAPDATESSPARGPRHAGFSFSIGTLLLTMTLVAICTALVAALPGLGILLCILLAPVLLRTALVVKRRERKGLPVSMGEKAGLVAGSLVITLVIITVVFIAAIGTFCAVCVGTYDVLGGDVASLVALITAGAVTLPLCFLFFRWSRDRYRRDVGDKNEY